MGPRIFYRHFLVLRHIFCDANSNVVLCHFQQSADRAIHPLVLHIPAHTSYKKFPNEKEKTRLQPTLCLFEHRALLVPLELLFGIRGEKRLQINSRCELRVVLDKHHFPILRYHQPAG